MITPFSGPFVNPYANPYNTSPIIQPAGEQALPPQPEASLPRAIN